MRAASSGDVRVSLAPHAPYSVSPALFTAIRARPRRARRRRVRRVHLGESPEEVEFLAHGTGPWRDAARRRSASGPTTGRPPGVSPVEYLADLGFLDSRVLAVHGVQFDGDDLARLRALGHDAGVVSAQQPLRRRRRSPPLEAFYAMGVDVAFGTDSLASVADLNLFGELAEARRLAPRVPARDAARERHAAAARARSASATSSARIEPGKRAALIAVRVPAGVSDVEEYLVSGIEPDAITWLD